MKRIVALVGPIGSGKDVVKKYLEEKHKAESVKFSQILRDILDRLDIKIERGNLQKLSTGLRGIFGEDLLSKAIVKDIKNKDSDFVILDGVRRMRDIDYVKDLEGFSLIGVDANHNTRFQRIKERNENEGDENKTFEEFMADQEKEADKEIMDVIKEAESVIDNNGTLEELYKEVDKVFDK